MGSDLDAALLLQRHQLRRNGQGLTKALGREFTLVQDEVRP